MEMLLSFFSDLILFTAGLAVVIIWIILFILIGIEMYDAFTEEEPEEEEYNDA